MIKINYISAYYRRNNKGQPCVWYGTTVDNTVVILYGILGKTISQEIIKTNRHPFEELQTRIKDKRKSGYKMLSEVSDSNQYPVEESDIIHYLNTYLEHNRTTADGSLLPMLAKLYDNTKNRLFKDGKTWIGQPKINGLRCLISATKNGADMFSPVKLVFQSREGTYWYSLFDLERELIKLIPKDLLDFMINENYVLDGELFLYGHAVNEINHIVKDPKDPKNKLLQFWCYDIIIQDMSQRERSNILNYYLLGWIADITTKEFIINNLLRLVYVPTKNITNDEDATKYRNHFINIGHEGLILRDPNKDYQFGKRNDTMNKYKAVTDGKFMIVDIKPEGNKREGIPLLVLKNDINEHTFSTSISGSFDYQKSILINKEQYIGKVVFVEYGERSGVKQVPFHCKDVILVID